MFSRRLPDDLELSRWARARAAHAPILHDLTVSNPTRCGLLYPDHLLDPLADARGLSYDPDPRGLRPAREVVAAEFVRRGVSVDPEHIVLAASSSDAYGMLFRLLCDPGAGVLVPSPSYPLLAHLAALDGLDTVPYRLDATGGWAPLPPSEEAAARARAAIVVNPNNPTGSWVTREAADRLARVRGDREPPLPLIVDEVFLDFPLTAGASPETFAGRTEGLTFTLGGLSKSRGLPQLKLSWIVVSGPPVDVEAAMARLEFVADTYLSVATPVQLALPEILERGRPVAESILSRCRENLEAALDVFDGTAVVEVVRPDAGWNVVLRFPNVVAEEDLAVELLERDSVAVYPGFLFDFPTPGWLVASLLPPRDTFRHGLLAIRDAIARRVPR
jgi:aspartate/methionine/tyrosine aminotransferase